MILPFNKLDISIKDLVLEVESGHRPSYCSDVLCDKYLTEKERGGTLKKDRLFFLADCESLPFKDKAFDYTICCQVFEHVQDLAKCCEELSRVSKKGYIETPSLFWKKLHPTRKYHRWFILLINNTLIFYNKDKCEQNSVFGKLFEIMYSNSLEYHLFFQAYRNLFKIRYEWRDRINYVVNPGEEYFRSFFLKPWGIKEYRNFYPERSFNKQAADFLGNLFSTSLLLVLRKPRECMGRVLKEYKKRTTKIDTESILFCPYCKGHIKIAAEQIKCLKCDAIFVYRNGVPDMVPENYRKRSYEKHVDYS
ncbi:MAG: class I SAM-dependent methyltransferase [Candidatus Omnitrophica bacterium]|nr:class I SAM-dependent methyltransferase [Candidatus Omnitrophota bacterium]